MIKGAEIQRLGVYRSREIMAPLAMLGNLSAVLQQQSMTRLRLREA
jgi:hypothetical protein